MRRAGTRVIGLVLLALAVASCTAVSAANKTRNVLTDRGYTQVRVQPQPKRDATLLRVSYATKATDLSGLTAEYADVAKIVWQSAPMRFDAVDISANDAPVACTQKCMDRFDRAQLAAAHGLRDPALDRDARPELLGAAGVFVAVIAGAVAMTIIVLARSRRRRRAPRPPAYTPPGWVPRPGSSTPGPLPGPPLPGSPPPPSVYAPPQWPGTSARPAASAPAWPPQTPPPAYEPPPPPLVVPTHDIWARLPS